MNDSPATAVATEALDGAGKHGPIATISDVENIDLPLQTRADVRLEPDSIDAKTHTEDGGAKVEPDILPADRTRKVCRPDVREADLNSVQVSQG